MIERDCFASRSTILRSKIAVTSCACSNLKVHVHQAEQIWYLDVPSVSLAGGADSAQPQSGNFARLVAREFDVHISFSQEKPILCFRVHL